MISVAQRLFGVPLLLHPARAIELARFVGERQGLDVLALARTHAATAPGRDRPYDVVNGIARIPIEGTLVHKSSWMDAASGLMSYQSIGSSLDEALADRAARAIALVVNSPGGETAGMFDLADRIYAMRGKKPLWAILDESAYSAGYALASSADVVIVPRTGGTGSIGVIAVHAEASRALDKAGITVTVMRYGDRKARANDLEPLQDEDRKELQADIDRIGEEFIALVARNRGVSGRAIRDQQAATFMGEAGVGRGLADAVAAPDAALQLLQEILK